MKYFNVSFNQVSTINDFVSDYSDLTVLGYNDTELTVSIRDKVNPGANRPKGGKVMNNSVRSQHLLLLCVRRIL